MTLRPQSLRLKPFAAVVFDMDGTLLDTELVFKSVVYETAAGLGFEMREEVHLATVGSSHEMTKQILADAYGVNFPHIVFEEQCRTLMRQRMAESVPIKPGVGAILDHLEDLGLPMAVATSSRRNHADTHLKRAGFHQRFKAIVTREDVGNPKPHPEPFLMAARLLGVAPQNCLAIEDSGVGIRAAHGAGMQVIMVPDLVAPTDAIRRLCAAVLPDLETLRRLALAPAG